ncbi:MAG: hypothetical protein U0872_11670 [Planctomycetaceae bacterium]
MTIANLADDLKSLLDQPVQNIEHATQLARLLAATDARAVACWQAVGETLELAGFWADDEMPSLIQQEFVAAIRSVPLTASHFGVVQAVLARGPAVNHRAISSGPLPPGSIGWLVRLDAESSLAIPVYQGANLVGAFAVATGRRIEPDDQVWQLLKALAALLETT